jgi:DNA-binding NarL/FixJ family response regulator
MTELSDELLGSARRSAPPTTRAVLWRQETQPLRVAIADDHPLVRQALRLALRDAVDIELVDEVASGADLLQLVAHVPLDLVLLDLRMPGLDGLACLDLLRRQDAELTVIVLSDADDARLIGEALRRGATAYLSKACDPSHLASAIRLTYNRTLFTALPPVDADSDIDVLSPREREVLAAITGGLSNHEAARRLTVSEQTVKYHLTNIYRKLHVANRTEAARLGYRHGLVAPQPTEPSANGGPGAGLG